MLSSAAAVRRACCARPLLDSRGYATSQSPKRPPPLATSRGPVVGPSSMPVHKKNVRPPPPPPPPRQNVVQSAAPISGAVDAESGSNKLGSSKSLFQSYQSVSYANKLRLWFGIIGTSFPHLVQMHRLTDNTQTAFSAAGLMMADRLEGRKTAKKIDAVQGPAATNEGAAAAKYIDHKPSTEPAVGKAKLFGITVVDRK